MLIISELKSTISFVQHWMVRRTEFPHLSAAFVPSIHVESCLIFPIVANFPPLALPDCHVRALWKLPVLFVLC